MGFSKHVVIESKVFSLSKDCRFLLITERSLKVVKELRLGLSMVHWLAKSLEDCLKGDKQEFYTMARDGCRSFIAQRCSNAQGHYMALVEYGNGNRCNFVFIPEDTKVGDGRAGNSVVEVCK